MRVFLALDLPMVIRSQLVLQQFLLPVKRKQPPENFHITMLFLGDLARQQLEELDNALERLDVVPFPVQIAELGLFGGAKAHNLHARVTPSPELTALHDKLVRLARGCGLRPEARRFSPHVTLAYLKPGMFHQPELEAAVVRDAGFRTESFEVSELVLYRSHLRSDGAQYDVLERYPFTASGRTRMQLR
ncbi:MAG: RNA 2',3'-cyclic phosphodiesterase [Roseinatronobacter sp.]